MFPAGIEKMLNTAAVHMIKLFIVSSKKRRIKALPRRGRRGTGEAEAKTLIRLVAGCLLRQPESNVLVPSLIGVDVFIRGHQAALSILLVSAKAGNAEGEDRSGLNRVFAEFVG